MRERRRRHGRFYGVYIRPYLVADAAFPLVPTLMKCYQDTGNLTARQKSFNYRQIRTRQAVEQAFGRLKGRFRVPEHNYFRDPTYLSQITAVCCGVTIFVTHGNALHPGDGLSRKLSTTQGETTGETTGLMVMLSRSEMCWHAKCMQPSQHKVSHVFSLRSFFTLLPNQVGTCSKLF